MNNRLYHFFLTLTLFLFGNLKRNVFITLRFFKEADWEKVAWIIQNTLSKHWKKSKTFSISTAIKSKWNRQWHPLLTSPLTKITSKNNFITMPHCDTEEGWFKPTLGIYFFFFSFWAPEDLLHWLHYYYHYYFPHYVKSSMRKRKLSVCVLGRSKAPGRKFRDLDFSRGYKLWLSVIIDHQTKLWRILLRWSALIKSSKILEQKKKYLLHLMHFC